MVDLDAGKQVARVETGLHPSDVALSPDGRRLYVANANSDTVSVVDVADPAAAKVVENIPVRPDPALPFGSAPNGVALVRQLAHGERLRFGFTPFNAPPAMVEFAVQGFEPASLVASTCGWKL